MDFAIFVFNPDDIVIMRGKKLKKVRDNVLFELGLFIGKLGRDKVFIIAPQGNTPNMPSDLMGVTIGKYESDRSDANLQSATGSVCSIIKNKIKKNLPVDGTKKKQPPESENEEKKIEQLSIEKEKEKEHESESVNWIDHYLKSEYTKAIEKLENEMSEKHGKEKINLKIWKSYIELKSNGKKEIGNYKSLINELLSYPDLLPLALNFFSFEYPDDAKSLAENLFEKDKENTQIGNALANLYINHDNIIEARDLLISLNPELNPDVAINLIRTYPEKTSEKLHQIRLCYLNHPNNKEIKATYVAALYDNNQFKEALHLYDSLLISDSNNTDYLGMISNTCLSLGFYDIAIAKAKKAYKLSEGSQGWIIHNVGNMLSHKGFHTEAIEWLKEGLEVEKESAYAHERLAFAIKSQKEELKKYNEACAEGKKMIKNATGRLEGQ